jgi:prepilin-type N-terminal cleavage/methylation domain-containing protein
MYRRAHEVIMQSKRRGVTLLELVIVLTMVGIVAGITVSGYTRTRARVQNGTAQRYLEAYAVGARAAAMQRGRSTTLNVQGDRIWVTADSVGAELPLRPPIDLRNNFGVTASATPSTVSFDARGFASGLPQTGARFVIAPATGSSVNVRDTVCVSRTGQIRTRGCA